jgi:mono/diheme cytochrome c family protein
MLSTIALVVAGLSTGHKIGLAAVGATFIVFALVSSFVIPRRSPNFPGKFMPVYVAVCALFFVAMLTAVLVFGKEAKESTGNEAPAATSTQSTPPAQQPGEGGNATSGKKVFASAGCGGCHTLKDAGASGTVGPNLDQLKPAKSLVEHQVTNGGGGMPPFKGQLTPEQIDDVAAYVASVTG